MVDDSFRQESPVNTSKQSFLFLKFDTNKFRSLKGSFDCFDQQCLEYQKYEQWKKQNIARYLMGVYLNFASIPPPLMPMVRPAKKSCYIHTSRTPVAPPQTIFKAWRFRRFQVRQLCFSCGFFKTRSVMSRRKQPSTFDQVYEFSRGRIVAYGNCGLSFRKISSRVGRHQTTVMRIWDPWMQEGTTDRRGQSHPTQ
ncbi:uncharacterized protein TNCV_1261991 [Trichonephila clavipes]|nr:uncharacterized protein TNCV_1261991 [Trichonephila clavipes]